MGIAATEPMSGSTVQHDRSTEVEGQGHHAEGGPTFKDQVLGKQSYLFIL